MKTAVKIKKWLRRIVAKETDSMSDCISAGVAYDRAREVWKTKCKKNKNGHEHTNNETMYVWKCKHCKLIVYTK